MNKSLALILIQEKLYTIGEESDRVWNQIRLMHKGEFTPQELLTLNSGVGKIDSLVIDIKNVLMLMISGDGKHGGPILLQEDEASGDEIPQPTDIEIEVKE